MYLCICNNIKESEFNDILEKYPEMPFDEICQVLGVAQECGGCIHMAYDLHKTQQSS